MIRLAPMLALAVAGCVTVEAPDAPAQGDGTGRPCDAAPAQRFVGMPATQGAGAEILRLTGAAVFQWIAPGTIVTLEFRADRVRVDYDAGLTIRSVRCG